MKTKNRTPRREEYTIGEEARRERKERESDYIVQERGKL